MYKPVQILCEHQIQLYCKKFLDENWNYAQEKIFRLPLSGELFDAMNTELETMGLPQIGVWSIFARGPKHIQVIHSDFFDDHTRINNAIIIPVLGTTGSKFQWFKDENHSTFKILLPDKKTHYHHTIFNGKPEIIEELEITEPIIANVRNPHRAVAADSQPRAIVSIKLKNNPFIL